MAINEPQREESSFLKSAKAASETPSSSVYLPPVDVLLAYSEKMRSDFEKAGKYGESEQQLLNLVTYALMHVQRVEAETEKVKKQSEQTAGYFRTF